MVLMSKAVNKAANHPQATIPGPHKPHQFAVKADVASLWHEEIAELDDEELVQMIRAAKLPLIDEEFEKRLQFCSRETLERIAHLACHCCRNQGF